MDPFLTRIKCLNNRSCPLVKMVLVTGRLLLLLNQLTIHIKGKKGTEVFLRIGRCVYVCSKDILYVIETVEPFTI